MSHQIKAPNARELFRLANVIQQKEPWENLTDNDWFGICNPESGDIQVVAVMGAARQVYGVHLYLPDEGIRFWNNIFATHEVNSTDALHNQRMIECEFCDEEDLPDEDTEFNALYGNPVKETYGLPVFRSYRPSYYPWFLEENEAVLMCDALLLTGKFHSECLGQLDSFYRPTEPDGMPEIPVYHLRKGGDRANAEHWEIRMQPFPIAPEKQLSEIPADDLFFNRFKGKSKKPAQWEIGCFYLDTPMMDDGDERPYLPILGLCLDPEGDSPPNPGINHPEQGLPTALRKAFSEAVEAYGYLPTELHVSSPTATLTFQGLDKAYGVKVVQVEQLPNMSQLASPLIAALSGGLSPQMLEALSDEDFDPTKMSLDKLAELESLLDESPFDIPPYSPPKSKTRYVMRIDLKGAKPPIWRRITIPTDATFFDLHCAIQDAMGWEDVHLHSFEIRTGRSRIYIEAETEYESLGPFGENLNEHSTKLEELVARGHQKFNYTYDYGDNWEHEIKIEKTLETDIAHPLPTILKGNGACPPEDCGGLWGYYDLIKGNDKELLEEYSKEELKSIRNEVFDIESVEFFDPSKRMGVFF